MDALHPGARVAISKLGMNELDIARAMAAGDLTSPQKYMGLNLFNMRITGTGQAYRTAHKEYVWRDPSLYLNDDFLARAAGIEVIWEHPDKQILDSKEYAQRTIGSIMLPYIKGDEVWGIARIRDSEAADMMEKGQLSTSPSVVLSDDRNTVVKNYRDKKPLLIEGDPKLLDHLAVCEQGVWDKGGQPVGVESTNTGDGTMPEETEAERKAREDKAKADADAGQKLDNILDHLKLGNARLDSIEDKLKKSDARMDAMDARHKRDDSMDARRRRADDDAGKHRDDDDDAKFKARMDAEEGAEREELEKEGEPKEVAADRAKAHRADKEKFRDDRRKRDDDARRKRADDDAVRCGDDDDDAKFKKRMDAEEEAEAKEASADAAKRHRADKERWRDDRRKARDDAHKRADSEVKRLVDEQLTARLPKADTEEERNAKAEAQFRCDSVYQSLGHGGAPPPLQGEAVRDYRVRLLRGIQKHSAAWKDIDISLLPGDALAIADAAIRNDATVASRNPADVAPGTLREVTITDPTTNQRKTEFFGRTTFIGLMKRPSMRLTGRGFKTANGGN